MHVSVQKHDNREYIIWSMAFQLLPYSFLLPPKNINQKSALIQKHITSFNAFKCHTACAALLQTVQMAGQLLTDLNQLCTSLLF